jgi:hypothetical protein
MLILKIKFKNIILIHFKIKNNLKINFMSQKSMLGLSKISVHLLKATLRL